MKHTHRTAGPRKGVGQGFVPGAVEALALDRRPKSLRHEKTNGVAVLDRPADRKNREPSEPSRVQVSIPQIEIGHISLKVTGDSPLISHAWSQKAIEMMLAKQMKKAKTAREAKDPWADFCDSLYWFTPKPDRPTETDVETAVFGFPCVAFKSAAVGACRYSDGIKMTEARGAFHVSGELAAIDSKPPKMRQDMVRIAMGTSDVRFRGEFTEWSVTLPITYNTAVLSPEQIVNLFNLAGFGVGVGEWRPEKDGSYGRFHVS
jgi:hypothetical protein